MEHVLRRLQIEQEHARVAADKPSPVVHLDMILPLERCDHETRNVRRIAVLEFCSSRRGVVNPHQRIPASTITIMMLVHKLLMRC